MIDEAKLKATVDRLFRLLVAGDYAAIEAWTGGVRLTAEDIEAAILEHGDALGAGRCTLVMPPQNPPRWDWMPVSVAEVPTWAGYVDLYTAEEGRSDLSLSLTVVENGADEPFYSLELDDIHVL